MLVWVLSIGFLFFFYWFLLIFSPCFKYLSLNPLISNHPLFDHGLLFIGFLFFIKSQIALKISDLDEKCSGGVLSVPLPVGF